MDIFDKCFKYEDAKLAILGGYYPYFIPFEASEGAEVVYKGRRIIMCGSNNYLGLTTHPKVKEAALEATRKYGTSCTGSRFLNGTLEMHEQLELELADFVGKPRALIFSTGMQTNLGTVSALVGRDDVVILDKEDHASIVDGARLGYGKLERYRHNDMEHLERVLKSIPDSAGRLIAVDGVFSMEGDLAPVPELVELCQKYGARLMIDDAHGIGVTGEGHGTAWHYGLVKEVDLVMSTFSKSFASLGGFIAGDTDVIDFIKHTARALIFSASPTPASTAAALAALKKMRAGFKRMGFDTGTSCTPIVPLLVGDNAKTFTAWKALFEAGVFVNPVIAPAVAPGRQLLRTSYMATHTDEQLDRVLDIFETVGKQVGLI
jgi:8-amino-7-oxononanoate synthase